MNPLSCRGRNPALAGCLDSELFGLMIRDNCLRRWAPKQFHQVGGLRPRTLPARNNVLVVKAQVMLKKIAPMHVLKMTLSGRPNLLMLKNAHA